MIKVAYTQFTYRVYVDGELFRAGRRMGTHTDETWGVEISKAMNDAYESRKRDGEFCPIVQTERNEALWCQCKGDRIVDSYYVEDGEHGECRKHHYRHEACHGITQIG